MAARPAPMTLAEARSICLNSSWKKLGLVKVDGVVDVQRRQDGEYVGLDRGHQQLERADEGHEQEAQDRDQDPAAAGLESLDVEIAEDVDQDVPGKHSD